MNLELKLQENQDFMQEIYSYAEGFIETTQDNTWSSKDIIENYYASKHYLEDLFDTLAEKYDVNFDDIVDVWISVLEEKITESYLIKI